MSPAPAHVITHWAPDVRWEPGYSHNTEREEEKTHGSYFLISVPIKDPLCALGPGSCPDGPVAWPGESGPGKLGRRGGGHWAGERGTNKIIMTLITQHTCIINPGQLGSAERGAKSDHYWPRNAITL